MLEIVLLCSNALIMVGMLILTLYRVRIEKRAVDLQVENAIAREKLKHLRMALEREQDMILNMSGKDFIEFLEAICNAED